MKTSPALAHVLHVWKHAKGSHQKRGHALWSALNNAIGCGLTFHEGDFRQLARYHEFHEWIGDTGEERAYALACGAARASENPSAALAMEKYLKRKPWLWAERTQKAERLYVGAKLTWQGYVAEVTSFNDAKQTLVACVTESQYGDDKEKVGSIHYYFDSYRKIEVLKRERDGTICARFSPGIHYSTKKILRRFTITHDELVAKRKDYDTRCQAILKQIAAANTLIELDAVNEQSAAQGTTRNAYRHFDLDILRAAFNQRREAILRTQDEAAAAAYEADRKQKLAAALERWMAGEEVHQHFNTIRVRIKDDRVEVSNGNSVTLRAADHALKFVKQHRAQGWSANGDTFDVDAFKVNRIDPHDGVTIGCTHFDWPEIERFEGLLRQHWNANFQKPKAA